jgi:hypothetical protein
MNCLEFVPLVRRSFGYLLAEDDFLLRHVAGAHSRIACAVTLVSATWQVRAYLDRGSALVQLGPTCEPNSWYYQSDVIAFVTDRSIEDQWAWGLPAPIAAVDEGTRVRLEIDNWAFRLKPYRARICTLFDPGRFSSRKSELEEFVERFKIESLQDYFRRQSR